MAQHRCSYCKVKGHKVPTCPVLAADGECVNDYELALKERRAAEARVLLIEEELEAARAELANANAELSEEKAINRALQRRIAELQDNLQQARDAAQRWRAKATAMAAHSMPTR